MRLIINSFEIELSDKTKITRTLQVNDIVSLSTRQSNYTNSFSVPRTPNNVKAFQMLGVIGVDSLTPYQRNNCYLYADSGEALVYNGWAVINSTDKDFKLNTYDGNIDLYKAIENKTLSELPLTEINHVKNLTNVVGSFNPASPYKYIIADYNGKSLYDTDKINIDYLVPSANVKYLWDKIFDFYGFTYEGSVFSTFNFQNLWLSYPKGIGSLTPDVEVFNLDTYELEGGLLSTANKSYIKLDTYTNNLAFTSIYNDRHIIFAQSNKYKIEVTANLNFKRTLIQAIPVRSRIMMGRGQFPTDLNSVVNPVEIIPYSYDTTLSTQKLIDVSAGENIFFYIQLESNAILGTDTSTIDIVVSQTQSSTIDFSSAFIDFKTRDFIQEICNRFGLTPFKDKYSNNYKFLTLYELLQDNDVIDWSAEKGKFVKQTNERYIYGSYAQVNNFVYKYNDNENTYNNGFINVDNVNLEDNKTVVNSFIYSPERDKTNQLFKDTNVYKLWNKEPKDDGTTTYKGLDKRFYFMRSDDYFFDTTKTIGSEVLNDDTIINSAPYESFFKLPFNDVITDYYLPIGQILNNSRLLDVEIYLTEKDVVDIDFSKLYWIKELNSYFILNKISNFSGNGIAKCEMIKVDYAPSFSITPILPITITGFVGGCLSFTNANFDTSVTNGFYKIQSSTDGGSTWYENSYFGLSPKCGYSLLSTTLFRFVDPITGNEISNIFEVVV